MSIKKISIVVLLSGGLDSSTVTGIAKKANANIYGLSFDYGQRHKRELEAASSLAKSLGVIEHQVITCKKRYREINRNFNTNSLHMYWIDCNI